MSDYAWHSTFAIWTKMFCWYCQKETTHRIRGWIAECMEHGSNAGTGGKP